LNTPDKITFGALTFRPRNGGYEATTEDGARYRLWKDHNASGWQCLVNYGGIVGHGINASGKPYFISTDAAIQAATRAWLIVSGNMRRNLTALVVSAGGKI